jgi:translocation and assembly module TamA
MRSSKGTKAIFILCGVLFTFFLISSVRAEQVEIDIKGVTDELLENVRAALTLPSTLIQDGKVQEKWLEHLVEKADETVMEALEPFGYYDPEVNVKMERGDPGTYRILVNVDPGEPVRVSNVSITMQGPGSDEPSWQPLISEFPLRKGDILNHADYEKAKGAFKAEAVSLGYLDADFTVQRILVSRTRRTAQIELRLKTGKKYFFGEIILQGGKDYPEEFLNRYVSFNTDDVFSYDRIGETQRNFLNSERFRVVTISSDKKDAKKQHIPVHIRLKPERPRNVRIGIGYGTDTGARFSTIYSNLNAFRRGHEIRSILNISELLQEIRSSYTVPSLTDLNSFKAIEIALQKEDTDSYKTTLFLLGANSTRSIGKGKVMTLFTNVHWEDSEISSEDVTSFLIIPGVRFSERRYDDLVRPTRGFRYQAETKGSHKYLFSETSFIQCRIDANTIMQMPLNVLLFLRMKGAVTLMDGSIDDLPASQRFFTGGDRSVRGYDYQSLGPKDRKGEVIGGKHLLVGSAELERAVYKNWGAAVFYDVGNAFNEFSDMDLRETAGIGLRYYTPIGAIRLDYARQIGVDNPDYKIHLTVGLEL